MLRKRDSVGGQNTLAAEPVVFGTKSAVFTSEQRLHQHALALRWKSVGDLVAHDGTLVLGRATLFHYVNDGARTEDLRLVVPLAALSHYGAQATTPEDGGHVVALHFLNDKLSPVYLMSRAGSQQAEYIAYAVVVFIDTLVLRHLRQEHQLAALTASAASPSVARRRSSAKESEMERDALSPMQADLSQVKLESEESLVYDRRARRLENSVSAYQIFIPGKRYVGKWMLALKKGAASDATTPMLCCVTPGGLVLLLPALRLIVPLYWREIGDCRAKKERVTFVHSYTLPDNGKHVVDHWTFVMPRGAVLERAMVDMQEKSTAFASKPLPKMYPPRPPTAAAKPSQALVMPMAPATQEEAAVVDRSVDSLQQARAQENRTLRQLSGGSKAPPAAAKGTARLARPKGTTRGVKTPDPLSFTMRFVSGALEIGDADSSSEDDADE